MRNKYRDIDIIEVDDYADIADIFMDCCYHTDKTVAVVAGYDVINHVVSVALEHDDVAPKYIDLLDEDDAPYFVSIDDDGNLVAMSAAYYDDLVDEIEVVYIDMDGHVSQDYIDYFVDKDCEVTLFGYHEEPICNTKECKKSCNCGLFDAAPLKTDRADKVKTVVKVDTDDLKYSEDEDGDMHGITVSKSDGTGRYESYSIYSTKEYSIDALKRLLPEWFK